MNRKLIDRNIQGITKTLTKAEIRKAFRDDLDLSSQEATQLLDGILETMIEAILTENSLKISSFGTFLVHKKKERIGRNPNTKKEAIITPRRSVSFRPSKILREKVSRGS